MNDVAAQMAHWLAGGRTAALVAPVVRLATAPGSHDLSKRAGRARDVLSDLDLETTRRAIERLSRDRRFREAISEASSRVEKAIQTERPGHRRSLIAFAALAVGIGGVAVYARRGLGTGVVAEPEGRWSFADHARTSDPA